MPPTDPSTCVVGIDLGATNMQIGVVDERNAVVAQHRTRTGAEDGADAVIDRIVEQIHLACETAGVPMDRLAAVGIAAAGAIDMPRGVILEAPNLRWENVSLRDILAERLGRPVALDNDVNGAVWGEYHLGAGRGRGDALGIWVGTGVGGGLVLNGALYHGELFTAGEIGHTISQPDGPPGARTVEDLCSRSGFARMVPKRIGEHPGSPLDRLTNGTGEITSSGQIGQAYAEGDPLMRELIDRSAHLLGAAIASWVTMLALDNVIIGGGVTEALGAPYLEMIRASFDRDVFPDRCRTCRLDATTLEDRAGILGAALLARARAGESIAAS